MVPLRVIQLYNLQLNDTISNLVPMYSLTNNIYWPRVSFSAEDLTDFKLKNCFFPRLLFRVWRWETFQQSTNFTVKTWGDDFFLYMYFKLPSILPRDLESVEVGRSYIMRDELTLNWERVKSYWYSLNIGTRYHLKIAHKSREAEVYIYSVQQKNRQSKSD